MKCKPTVSVVIPAYNAAASICATIGSIGLSHIHWCCFEVIVVDDGSNDGLDCESLFSDVVASEWSERRIIQKDISFSETVTEHSHHIKIIRLPVNCGKPYACNSGFKQSTGIAVIVLDADDEFVPEWAILMQRLLVGWPEVSPLCFARTIDDLGRATGSGAGLISREDWLAGKFHGEYLPIFRGDVARSIGYATPGCRKICGTLSYSLILQGGPLYFFETPMRIYHIGTIGSLSKNFLRFHKARDTLVCFRAARVAIEKYDIGQTMSNRMPPYLRDILFKEGFYTIFGDSRLRGLRFAVRNATKVGPMRLVVLVAVFALPRYAVHVIILLFKKFGILKAFG